MKHNNNVPAHGLLLWRAYFDEYNARARKNFEQGGGIDKCYEIILTPEILQEME